MGTVWTYAERMKTCRLVGLIVMGGTLMCAAQLPETEESVPPAAESSPATLRNMDKLPMGWLKNAKGYEKALELQKETDADIFIYFKRGAPPNEKGLCNWFEKDLLNHAKVRKWLKNYIRVEVLLPSNPDTQRLGEKFNVNKTPTLIICRPQGLPQRVKAFEYPDNRPKPVEHETFIEWMKIRSSAPYQTMEP